MYKFHSSDMNEYIVHVLVLYTNVPWANVYWPLGLNLGINQNNYMFHHFLLAACTFSQLLHSQPVLGEVETSLELIHPYMRLFLPLSQPMVEKEISFGTPPPPFFLYLHSQPIVEVGSQFWLIAPYRCGVFLTKSIIE